MLGLAASLQRGGASLLTYVKDNLKLYLDFKSNRSDTLAFPSEGSTNFDGTDDYINFGDLNISFPFSLSLWVRPDVLEEGPIFGIGSIWSTHEMTIYQEGTGGGVRWRINVGGSGGPGTSMAYENGVLTAGKWTHIAITADGTTGCMYIDGVRIGAGGSLSGTMFNSGQDNILGYQSGLGAQYFDGSMCNFGLWSRGLSGEEVQSVMNKSYSQLGSVEKTSLVSWWSLDDTIDAGSINNAVYDLTNTTLGNEVIGDPNFEDASYWSVSINGGTTDINTTNAGKFTNIDAQDNDITKNGILTAGQLYRIEIVVDTLGVGGTNNAGRWRWERGYTTWFTNIVNYSFDTGDTGTWVFYGIAVNTNFGFRVDVTSTFTATSISVKPVNGNAGVVTGATTTTSVYGNNSPVLPRAIDIAESQADAIGNGSSLFNGSSDYIDLGADVYDFSSGNFTISAWIYNDRHSNHAGIVGIRDNTGTEVQFYINSSTNKMRSWNGSDNVEATNVIPEDTWTYVSLVQSGGDKKFYINGILDNTATQGNGSARPVSLKIGYTGHSSEYYKGNISQLGIWAGALTQAQIQSLMESTSYAKIPADVKSTLSSELVTTISAGTNWSYDSSAETLTASNATATSYTNVLSGVSEGDLVKLSFDVTGHTGGSVYISCGGGDQNTSDFTNGSHAIYLVSGSGSQKIAFDGGTAYTAVLSNISVKEVTNDLVAYYPLDSGENSNMSKDYTVADSLMTFGDNLLADGDAGSDGWTNDTGGTNPPAVNEKSSEYAKEGTFSRKFVADGGTDAVNTPTFTTETGATYQVSFWIRPSSYSQNFYIYQGDGSGTNTFIAEATSTTWLRSYTANQWNKLVGYFTESGGGSNAYLQFESPSSSDVTYYIDEVKVKKVLSGNYGRLL